MHITLAYAWKRVKTTINSSRRHRHMTQSLWESQHEVGDTYPAIWDGSRALAFLNHTFMHIHRLSYFQTQYYYRDTLKPFYWVLRQ